MKIVGQPAADNRSVKFEITEIGDHLNRSMGVRISRVDGNTDPKFGQFNGEPVGFEKLAQFAPNIEKVEWKGAEIDPAQLESSTTDGEYAIQIGFSKENFGYWTYQGVQEQFELIVRGGIPH